MRHALLALLLAAGLAGCAGREGAVQQPDAEGAPTPPTVDDGSTTITPPPPTKPAPRPVPPTPEGGSARQMNVSIAEFAFAPADIVVAPGSTVTWTNDDLARHSIVLESDGDKRVGPLAAGEQGAITFPELGAFGYRCGLHDAMRGVVRVEELPPLEPEPAPPAKNHTVNMTGRSFDPSVLRVSLGSTITWVNLDSEWHEAESDWAGWFGSGLLNQGQSFSVVMDRTGTFGYRCDLHSMRGTLIVE